MAFRYCPDCGACLTERSSTDLRPQQCAGCRGVHYHNSKPCAGALVTRDDRLLLARRAREPFHGYWDIPGGFLDPGEHPEAAVVRELEEETGLTVVPTRLLGLYADTYGPNGHPTITAYYVARVVGGSERPADDVSELGWFDPDELPAEIAFAHAPAVLADWKRALWRDG